MKDYISREALIRKLHSVPVLKDHPNLKALCFEWANAIPAADVVEVVHGRWEEHFFDGIMGGRPRTYMCSYCNYTFPVKTIFCPNCGAKMDGGADKP